MVNRGIALSITLAFLAFVKPDPNPSLVGVALVAILMYEAVFYCSGYVLRVNRKRKIKRNTKELEYDISRWAEEWFNPYTEVS